MWGVLLLGAANYTMPEFYERCEEMIFFEFRVVVVSIDYFNDDSIFLFVPLHLEKRKGL